MPEEDVPNSTNRAAGPSQTHRPDAPQTNTKINPANRAAGPSQSARTASPDRSPSPQPKRRAKRARKAADGEEELTRNAIRTHLSTFMARLSSEITGIARERSMNYGDYLTALMNNQKVVLWWPVWAAVLGLGFHPHSLSAEEMSKFWALVTDGVKTPIAVRWPLQYRSMDPNDPAYLDIPLVKDEFGNVMATVRDVLVASAPPPVTALPQPNITLPPPLPTLPQPASTIPQPTTTLPQPATSIPQQVSQKRRRGDVDSSDEEHHDEGGKRYRKESKKSRNHIREVPEASTSNIRNDSPPSRSTSPSPSVCLRRPPLHPLTNIAVIIHLAIAPIQPLTGVGLMFTSTATTIGEAAAQAGRTVKG
ncbi:hypothetical protein H0H93_001146 [Arthromyces matolae]|nr:hypothetical protein H0H93_001146 [Arthromyces matolae]